MTRPYLLCCFQVGGCCKNCSRSHTIVSQITKFILTKIGGEHYTNIVLDSNLEDKVLIEDDSIVMNQLWPNIDIYTDAT